MSFNEIHHRQPDGVIVVIRSICQTFILSAIAILGMATPAFAKDKAPKNTENNVSSDTEQVAEHDVNVYGANYTDGDKFDGLTRKVGFDRMIPPSRAGGLLQQDHSYHLPG